MSSFNDLSSLTMQNNSYYPYFAYGSNMLKARLEERVGTVSYLGKAILMNYTLNFSKLGNDGSGKASIIEEEGSVVEGAIYQLTKDQMKILNRFEGFPKHYTKLKLSVTCEESNKKRLKVVTYVANPDYIREDLLPTKEYLDFILRGALEIQANETFSKLKDTPYMSIET